MNICREVDGQIEAVTDFEAEFVGPDWVFGLVTYAFMADGSILAVARSGGRDQLVKIDAEGGLTPIDLPFTEIAGLSIDGDRVVFRAAAADRPNAVIELAPGRVDEGAPPSEPEHARARGRLDPAAHRVPDDRRPARLRQLLPADQPLVRRAAGHAAAAHRDEPRRPDRGRVLRLRDRAPAVHQPRLRRARRGLRRLDRLRQGRTASGSSSSGGSSTSRTASPARSTSSSRASSMASGSRSAAAARAASRRSPRWRSPTSSTRAARTSGSATCARS